VTKRLNADGPKKNQPLKEVANKNILDVNKTVILTSSFETHLNVSADISNPNPMEEKPVIDRKPLDVQRVVSELEESVINSASHKINDIDLNEYIKYSKIYKSRFKIVCDSLEPIHHQLISLYFGSNKEYIELRQITGMDQASLIYHIEQSVNEFKCSLIKYNKTCTTKIESIIYHSQDEIINRIVTWVYVPEPQDSQRHNPSAPAYLRELIEGRGKSSYAQITSSYEFDQTERKRQFIARFLPALKEELHGRSHGDYASKLEIARWINAELKRFDLAITSKEFVGVATLSADAGGKKGEGRFQLKGKERGKGGEAQNFYTQSLTALLDEVIVLDAPPRREALSEFREKGRKPKGGASRS
jgi:hypothetical protein